MVLAVPWLGGGRRRGEGSGASMSWVKTDDGAAEHMKHREAGSAAFALWNAALGFCNRNLTDGRLRIELVPDVWRPIGERFDHKRAASKLVQKALWHPPGSTCRSPLCPANSARSVQLETIPDAYLVHDYFEYQKSKAEILVEREKNSNRQQKHRLSKMAGAREDSGHDVSNGVTDAVTDGVTNSVSNATPDPAPDPAPDPVPVDRERSRGAVNLEAFAAAVANAGIAIQIGGEARERFAKLYPLESWELEHALARAKSARATQPGYVLTVIENERKAAAEVRRTKAPPPAAGRTPPPARRGPRNVGDELERAGEEFASEPEVKNAGQ